MFYDEAKEIKCKRLLLPHVIKRGRGVVINGMQGHLQPNPHIHTIPFTQASLRSLHGAAATMRT